MTLPAKPPGRVSLIELLLGSGPRFARDALGPVLAFYVAWRVAGLFVGVVAATLVAVLAFWWQRRQAGTGIMPAIGLGIAAVQAVVGLASGSASAFFAPGVIANGLYGGVFVSSVALGRPLAGVFAGEMYAFPRRVRDSALFRRTFSVVSLVWGGYMLLRSSVRLLVLLWSSVDLFVVVSIVTGIPCTLALMTWSFWYPLRAFRRQPELWGVEEPGGAADASARPPSAST
jgi:intracellular septation protein A